MNTHIVIMAGGVGSRFWPLSTPEYPKQFIDVLGCGKSLIQLTADRFKGICEDANFWVVTNCKYVDIVKQQLPFISQNHILAEPAARNTAPCIAWACWMIKREDSCANIIVSPSDAVVMNPEEFRRVIKNALAFTEKRNDIVTIGIKPSRPETGYGYVAACTSGMTDNSNEILSVDSFKEKPDKETAEKYVEAGNYLWNAGIFVWNADTIITAMRKYKPNIASDMDKIMETGNVEELFPLCEKISIDFAVMEPAASEKRVYTHPADFGWSDLGNWASLHDKLVKDDSNNGVVGNVHLYECSNCIVHTEDERKVVLHGLDGYIVSEKANQLLVCKRSEEQRIKEFSLR